MIRIAIVEDEEFIRKQLRKLIESRNKACKIAEFASGDEFLLAKEVYSLIFLDIQMEGSNGIEVAKELRRRQESSVIIFVTALKDYVFQAFDVSAFHYLMKPIRDDQFGQVFDRSVKYIGRIGQYNARKVQFQMKGKSIILEEKDILYLENRLKKIEIHTVKDTIELYATMKNLELQLGEAFFRCHRGYLVNMEWIQEYNSSMITLKNGESIYLAKEKYSIFKKTYMRYLQNGSS